MGLRFTVLTILLIIVWITGPSFYKAHTGCGQCHGIHYEKEGTCVNCHRGNPRSNRKQIAHYQLIPGKYSCFTLHDNTVVENGYRLIKEIACRRCHRIGNKGNTLASNLDLSFHTKAPESLAHAIKNPSIFMPDFNFFQTDILRLINAILDSGSVNSDRSDEVALTVHFENNKKEKDNVFNMRCGPCHRILTKRFGGLGQKDMGPNLSGLFSEFYFQSFDYGKCWNLHRLKRWLKNPREIRSGAKMPPVQLNDNEFINLINVLDRDYNME